ncbi:MAG TPA: hypothetical protein VLQ91_18695 [Draconibacterium sp.]|jgi:hypothetical protein|nr:hypothetical protein [Draconibacterium sp.]
MSSNLRAIVRNTGWLAAIFVWHPEVLGITIAFWTAIAYICLGIFRIVLIFRI